jgi:hypothetical protein
MKYPTVIIENFFENPDEIVNYSNTLTFKGPEKNEYWIGKRSEMLHKINIDLFNFICSKVISIFYNCKKEIITFSDAQVCFQKIGKTDVSNCLKTKNNMLHRDIYGSLTGVIYLSKKQSFENGTKISTDEKIDHILVSSKYNSMLCYEGSQLHGPIGSENEDRLTIVFFIHKVQAEEMPYERLNNIKGF